MTGKDFPLIRGRHEGEHRPHRVLLESTLDAGVDGSNPVYDVGAIAIQYVLDEYEEALEFIRSVAEGELLIDYTAKECAKAFMGHPPGKELQDFIDTMKRETE